MNYEFSAIEKKWQKYWEENKTLVELCVEPAGLCGRCTGVAVPLRVVPSPQGCLRRGVRASGPSQGRTGESGAFGMWPHPRGSSRISS